MTMIFLDYKILDIYIYPVKNLRKHSYSAIQAVYLLCCSTLFVVDHSHLIAHGHIEYLE
jgi:hypothetical protein